jgi:hypothetical protein
MAEGEKGKEEEHAGNATVLRARQRYCIIRTRQINYMKERIVPNKRKNEEYGEIIVSCAENSAELPMWSERQAVENDRCERIIKNWDRIQVCRVCSHRRNNAEKVYCRL